jgi:replicative DNA helicase
MVSSVNGTETKEKLRQQIGTDIVFTASDAAGLTREIIVDRQKNETSRVHFGTPDVDRYLIPFFPGDLTLICGRPQNYKSGIMQTILHRTVDEIEQDERAMQECGVLVTWEVSVEKAAAYWLAVASKISTTEMLRGNVTVSQWEDLDLAVTQVSQKPFFIVGHSTKRSVDNRRRRPNLTTANVDLALDYIMNDMGYDPRIITLDYLQRIPAESDRMNHNEHIMRSVDWAKDLGLWAGCPTFLGTQADRRVDDYQVKMPKLRDSQWSSNAEQSADFFISTHMPKTAGSVGKRLDFGEFEVDVTERVCVIAVAKQKDGPAGKLFPLYVEPEYLKMGDLDRNAVKRNGRQ